MARKKRSTEKSAVGIAKPATAKGQSLPTPDNTTILAFANFKGGVGKTTCAVNVAGCLAYQFDKKVLLVDLDVQASLGQWLLGPEDWWEWSKERAKTSYQIFVDIIMGSHAWNVLQSTYRVPQCPKLHVCPATFDMVDLDTRLHNSLNKPIHPKPFQCLDLVIKPICGQFDYVIFDCPPNMYLTTQNAIFCADYVIIPTLPDFLSTAGLKRLVGFLHDLREQFLLFDPTPIRIAGIVFDQYDRVRKETMDSVISDIESYVEQHRHEDDVFRKNAKVFNRRIRRLSALAHAQESKLPVSISHPSSEAAKDFIQLTHEIMEVI